MERVSSGQLKRCIIHSSDSQTPLPPTTPCILSRLDGVWCIDIESATHHVALAAQAEALHVLLQRPLRERVHKSHPLDAALFGAQEHEGKERGAFRLPFKHRQKARLGDPIEAAWEGRSGRRVEVDGLVVSKYEHGPLGAIRAIRGGRLGGGGKVCSVNEE